MRCLEYCRGARVGAGEGGECGKAEAGWAGSQVLGRPCQELGGDCWPRLGGREAALPGQAARGRLRDSSIPPAVEQGSSAPSSPDKGPEAQEGSHCSWITAHDRHRQDLTQRVWARPTITTHPLTLIMLWAQEGLGGLRRPGGAPPLSRDLRPPARGTCTHSHQARQPRSQEGDWT